MTSAITPTDELTRRHPVPPDGFTFEPSERRVRGTIGTVTLVDSHSPMLVWEPGQAVPGYVFPREDVQTDLLRPTSAPAHDRHQRVGRWYDVEVDGTRYPALAFEYDVDGLKGFIGIDWFRRAEPGVEHWYEEAEEIFRHPQGDARYWSVQTPERLRENIVWSYPDPVRAAAAIKDHLAVYNEVVDIVVDDVPLSRPQSEFTGALAARRA
jgi:uncharacterized protein (DUF427 family)